MKSAVCVCIQHFFICQNPQSGRPKFVAFSVLLFPALHDTIENGCAEHDLLWPFGIDDPVNVFCYYILLPIALVLKMTDSGQYDTFISSRNAKPLTELFEQSKTVKDYIGNKFQGKMKPFDVAIDTIEELEYVYQQVFRFDSGYMNEFLCMVNLLSPFASYLV